MVTLNTPRKRKVKPQVPRKILAIKPPEYETSFVTTAILEIKDLETLQDVLVKEWVRTRIRGERVGSFVIDETWFKEIPQDFPDGKLLFIFFGCPVYFSRHNKHVVALEKVDNTILKTLRS